MSNALKVVQGNIMRREKVITEKEEQISQLKLALFARAQACHLFITDVYLRVAVVVV
jgi:hypothetical protein